MKTPTVILRKGSQRRLVDVHEYALNLTTWQAKGWQRDGETRGETSDAQEAGRRLEAEIEHERTRTREPRKDQAQRALRVGTPIAKQEP